MAGANNSQGVASWQRDVMVDRDAAPTLVDQAPDFARIGSQDAPDFARAFQTMTTSSRLETLFWLQLEQAGLTEGCEREYRFNPPRRFRFDFAWPHKAVAAEIDGGGYVYGRHNRPAGQGSDAEKGNIAQLLGWHVYRFTGKMLNEDDAVPFIKQALG